MLICLIFLLIWILNIIINYILRLEMVNDDYLAFDIFERKYAIFLISIGHLEPK